MHNAMKVGNQNNIVFLKDSQTRSDGIYWYRSLIDTEAERKSGLVVGGNAYRYIRAQILDYSSGVWNSYIIIRAHMYGTWLSGGGTTVVWYFLCWRIRVQLTGGLFQWLLLLRLMVCSAPWTRTVYYDNNISPSYIFLWVEHFFFFIFFLTSVIGYLFVVHWQCF